MASIYTKYKNQLENYFAKRPELRIYAAPDEVMPTEDGEAAALAESPGGQVLARIVHGTIGEFHQAFCAVFTDGQFRWIGSQGFSPTRVMETLDGDRTSGECAILANAFWALWACPKPFGLGKTGALLVDFNNDDEDDGFISPHPPGGIRTLGPNIVHPFGELGDARNCLYAWGNHKVISFGGRFYDPSYRTIYDDTSEMVAFEYTGRDQMINGERITQIRATAANPARGWKIGDLMYLRIDLMRGPVGPYRAVGGWRA